MTAELWLYKPCEHGELEPHGWVCGAHDTDEKCPRQNCEAHLDFGDHCAGLHRNNDACWSASACGGGSRVRLDPDKVVFTIPNDMWGTDDEYTVQDVIDALPEEESQATLDELSRFSEELELYEDELSGDCETDCQETCAYPGQFTECEL